MKIVAMITVFLLVLAIGVSVAFSQVGGEREPDWDIFPDPSPVAAPEGAEPDWDVFEDPDPVTPPPGAEKVFPLHIPPLSG